MGKIRRKKDSKNESYNSLEKSEVPQVKITAINIFISMLFLIILELSIFFIF